MDGKRERDLYDISGTTWDVFEAKISSADTCAYLTLKEECILKCLNDD